ncbi:MAG: hypothetical protein J2P25_08840 [Nocardiopsaceae bacterium]|nr:hypothetical protein [Nocardiopsaceae bacterium]
MTLPGDIGGASTNLELKDHGAEIRRLLMPDERLLDLTDFVRATGKDLLETPPPPPDTRSGGRKAAEAAAGVALYPVLGSPPSLKRMLGGVSTAGRIGSWAYRLVEAEQFLRKDKRLQYLLVTDRRLLLAGRELTWGKGGRDYAAALEVPRGALVHAAREGRPFARGRVVLAFADGSMVALDLGSFRTGAARTLIKALASPGTVTPLPV